MNKSRAVIYARCSTEEESQKDALITQEQEAVRCVEKKGWVLIDRYVESKSGTSVKGRDEYKRLYEELGSDKFDIIVIKSQDRLMRNVKDWYLFLDRMSAGGKQLYMYLEGHFYSADDSLITGIKAILAEEYSRELSKKINNAHRSRQESGSNVVITSKTYGFDKVGKKVVVNKEEAVIVRRMFELCVQGCGSRSIQNILYNEGYRNRNGKAIGEAVIRKIIRNPIHKGTIIMNKSHYDFDTKRRIALPETEWIYHVGAVPPIVSEKLWEEANREMDSRRIITEKGAVGKNKGVSNFSGKLWCGCCGQPYYRTSRRVGKERRQIYEWKCAAYLAHGRRKKIEKGENIKKAAIIEALKEENGCDNIILEEGKLISILYDNWGDRYRENYPKYIRQTLKVLRHTLLRVNNSDKLIKIEKDAADLRRQLEVLLDKLLKEVITDSVYKEKRVELNGKLQKAELQAAELSARINESQNIEQRMESIERSIEDVKFFERIVIADMLEKVKSIEVYWDHLNIRLNSDKIPGMDSRNKTSDRQTCEFRIELGTALCREKRIEEQEIWIMNYMKSNPTATAAQTAAAGGLKKSTVDRRIASLRKKGKVHYTGKDGHHWREG